MKISKQNRYILSALLTILLVLSACGPRAEPVAVEPFHSPTGAAPTASAADPQATATLAASATLAAPATPTDPPTEAPLPSEAPAEATTVAAPTSVTPASTPLSGQAAIVVDRHAVVLFEHIPLEYLEAARNLKMMYADRSVGQNINAALDCLAAPSWEQSRAYCRRDYTGQGWEWKTFSADDLRAGAVPEVIRFEPDPRLYDRSNWVFEAHMGTWYALTEDFITALAPRYVATHDVLSYQLTYLNVGGGEPIPITDPELGYFSDNPDLFTIADLEDFIAQHPDTTFIFWTTSLARGIGTQTSTEFNDQMRRYAAEHGKILFDVADILSHTPDGQPCYDNRDGVEYCSATGNCENHPDDGFDYPAICQAYTTETEGGHLGSVSGGGIRVAKAFWVLMARIAGWEGVQ
jgi:hypothetical protein